MSLPLIGFTGKVPDKEPITHIAKPAPPMAAYPPFNSRKKRPAKANPMMISSPPALATKRSVASVDWCTERVGEENGTLKAKVVSRNRTNPKGQILCSLHTPRRRRNTIAKYFWTRPTRMLVPKKTGSKVQIWSRELTLT